MPQTIILFFLGMLIGKEFPNLPNPVYSAFGLVLSIVILFLPIKWLRSCAISLAGCSWFLLYAGLTLTILPAQLENKPLVVKGFIKTMPCIKNKITTFVFETTQIEEKSCRFNLQLYWRDIQKCRVGEKWQLLINIKRPHSLMNLGSFDLEKSYFQKKIQASGTIINAVCNKKLESATARYPIEQLRAKILENVSKLKSETFFGIILALTIGVTDYITSEQWQVFRATGTNHLVAISGLHIGLLASLFATITGWLWGRVPHAPLYLPTRKLQLMVGAMMATGYGVLSGFAPSTQRALIMLYVFLAGLFLNRKVSTFQSLLLSLGIIILFDPLAILSLGFWLSFLAVGCLIFGLNYRIGEINWWWRWGQPQWVVAIGMMPALIGFFGQISLLSFVANIIAIPIFSFIIIPLSLVGVSILLISLPVGSAILKIALWILNLLWQFLDKLSSLTCFIIKYSFATTLHHWLAKLAGVITLLPQGLLSKMMTFCWWLVCYSWSAAPLAPGQLQLVVFDVGQGLATLIRTEKHTLVFDTGVKTSDDFDIGKTVILPYLLAKGIKKIDVMVISHGDNDHIGGAKSILEELPVAKVMTSVPKRFKPEAAFCNEGLQWRWDGVAFKFLSPPTGLSLKGNNMSCVLKVTAKSTGILLTGDIEQKAEHLLIKVHAKELKSDILVVPHHGSKTSSGNDFLNAVMPSYAIFSYGYLNRYHHPDSLVIKRYLARKITVFDTVHSGAITMTFAPDSAIVAIQEFRKKYHKFWYQD